MNRSKIVTDRIVSGLSELAAALAKNEKISAQFRCRKVVLDLHPMPYSPKAVKAARKLLGASQTMFAQFLGVKTTTVQSWEQGRQSPSDMACRFLDEIQLKPDYFRERFRSSIKVKEYC
jgi:putative transcriptional regulator